MFAALHGYCPKPNLDQNPDQILHPAQVALLIVDVALMTIAALTSVLTVLSIMGVSLGGLGGISALTFPGALGLLGLIMVITVADAIALMMLMAKRTSLQQRLRQLPEQNDSRVSDRSVIEIENLQKSVKKAEAKADNSQIELQKKIQEREDAEKEQLKQKMIQEDQFKKTEREAKAKLQAQHGEVRTRTEEYNEAEKNCAIAETSQQQKELEQNEKKIIEDLKRQKDTLSQELKKLNDSLAQYKVQVDKNIQTIEENKKQAAQTQEAKEATQRLEEEQNKVLETHAQKVKEVQLLEAKLNALTEQLRSTTHNKDQLQQQIKQLEQEFDLCKEKMKLSEENQVKALDHHLHAAGQSKTALEEAFVDEGLFSVTAKKIRSATEENKTKLESQLAEVEKNIKKHKTQSEENKSTLEKLKEAAKSPTGSAAPTSMLTEPTANPLTTSLIGASSPTLSTSSTTATPAANPSLTTSAIGTIAPTPALASRNITPFIIEMSDAEQKAMDELEQEFWKTIDTPHLQHGTRLSYLKATPGPTSCITADQKLRKQTGRAVESFNDEAKEAKDFQTTFDVDLSFTLPEDDDWRHAPWDKEYTLGSWLGSENVGIAHSKACRIEDEDAFASRAIAFNMQGVEHKGEMHLVCDGHGEDGRKAKFVAQVFPKLIEKKLGQASVLDEAAIANALTASIVIIDSFLTGNAKADKQNKKFGEVEGGTTVSGILCLNNTVYEYNVGDSRCVLYKKTGAGAFAGQALTEDADFHYAVFGKKLVKQGMSIATRDCRTDYVKTPDGTGSKAVYKEDGRLYSEATNQPIPLSTVLRSGKISVARSVGGPISGQPKLGYLIKANTPDNVEEGRIFYDGDEAYMVIACDGFWDGVTVEQSAKIMEKMIQAKRSPKEMAAYLMRANLKQQIDGYFKDNVTIMVVRLP